MGTTNLDQLDLHAEIAQRGDASPFLSPCVHEAVRCLIASDGCDEAGGLTALKMTATAFAMPLEDVANAVIIYVPLDARDGATVE